MSDTITMTFDELVALAVRALVASNTSIANATPVARSIAAAERDGQKTVGLSYLPLYCEHAACGKVDGHAVPRMSQPSPVAIQIDAGTGFSHPAIALGLPALATAAHENGIAALGVGNSYSCGSLGYFVEELAEQGLVAFMAANASPSIAPFGGKTPFFGTNPIAFAAPRQGHAPMVIDQSSSVVARVAVIDAQRRGLPIPDGWAIDKDGKPTNDPSAALQGGSMLPVGGYKGFGLALMVDILAAGLTGSHWSFEASSFGNNEGGPPQVGQFIIAIAPEKFGGTAFAERLETMLSAVIETPAVRLPGDRRLAERRGNAEAIIVSKSAVELIEHYAAGTVPR